jgi:hypothetical protein
VLGAAVAGADDGQGDGRHGGSGHPPPDRAAAAADEGCWFPVEVIFWK